MWVYWNKQRCAAWSFLPLTSVLPRNSRHLIKRKSLCHKPFAICNTQEIPVSSPTTHGIEPQSVKSAPPSQIPTLFALNRHHHLVGSRNSPSDCAAEGHALPWPKGDVSCSLFTTKSPTHCRHETQRFRVSVAFSGISQSMTKAPKGIIGVLLGLCCDL